MSELTRLQFKGALLKAWSVVSGQDHGYLKAVNGCNLSAQSMACARAGDIGSFYQIKGLASPSVHAEAIAHGHPDFANAVRESLEGETVCLGQLVSKHQEELSRMPVISIGSP